MSKVTTNTVQFTSLILDKLSVRSGQSCVNYIYRDKEANKIMNSCVCNYS